MMYKQYLEYIKYKKLYLQKKYELLEQKGGLLEKIYIVYFNKNKLDRILQYYNKSKAFKKLSCFNYYEKGDCKISWNEICLLFGFDTWYIENTSNALKNIGGPFKTSGKKSETQQYDMLIFLKNEYDKDIIEKNIVSSLPILNALKLTGSNLDERITNLHSTYKLPDFIMNIDPKIFQQKTDNDIIKETKIDYPLEILNDISLHPYQVKRYIDSIIVIEVNPLSSTNKILWYHNFPDYKQNNNYESISSPTLSPISSPTLSPFSSPSYSPTSSPLLQPMKSNVLVPDPIFYRIPIKSTVAEKDLVIPPLIISEKECQSADKIICDSFEKKKAYLLWHLTI